MFLFVLFYRPDESRKLIALKCTFLKPAPRVDKFVNALLVDPSGQGKPEILENDDVIATIATMATPLEQPSTSYISPNVS